MATLSDLRTQIKLDTRVNGTEKDTQIDNAIRSALRQLRGKKYWFLRAIGDLTLSSGNSVSITATLTDFAAPDTFKISDGNTWRFDGRGFDFLTYENLERQYLQSVTLSTNIPSACAVLNGTLYTSHNVDGSYTIHCSYYKQDATLPTADAATSVWFDEGYDVVRALAMSIFKREVQGMSGAEDDSLLAYYLNQLSQTGMSYEQGGR